MALKWRFLTGIPDAEDPDDDNDGIPDIGKNIFRIMINWAMKNNSEDDDWHGELWKGEAF